MSLGDGSTRWESNDPEIFLATDDLELVGKSLAQTLMMGQHRGIRVGQGVEFHTHRSYEPGDDLRHINWRLYARQHRLYTRVSRRELQRPCHILCDTSRSMAVAHGKWSKHAYSTRIAAGLAQLAWHQRDSPGLFLFSKELRHALPARGGSAQVQQIWAELSRCSPEGSGDITASLTQISNFLPRSGLVLVISDFLQDDDAVLNSLGMLREKGNDVFALQLLDPMEVSLPTSGDFEFIDAESGERVRLSAENHWRSYNENVNQWRKSLAREASARGIHWHSATTNESIVSVMSQWLEQHTAAHQVT
jgi:uncharacterized protein (DUF58 family)